MSKSWELAPHNIKEQHILIDVRTPKEFSECSIEGSVNFPLEQIEEFGHSLDGEQDVVLISNSGNRAKAALDLLDSKGVEALILAGGVEAWMNLSIDLERQAIQAATLDRQVRFVSGALTTLGGLMAIWVHPYWGALPTLVGLELVKTGATGSCTIEKFLAKLPFNRP